MYLQNWFMGVCILGVASLAANSNLFAETAPSREKSGEAGPAQNSPQKYDGVAPGSEGRNPLPPAPADQPYLVWTGFQMTDSGSRVFLQTTRTVEFESKGDPQGKSGKGALTIILRSCKIHMANNSRMIDTRFFATPVGSVSAKERRGDVEIRILLREPSFPSPRAVTGADGTSFLVLDFPPAKNAGEDGQAPPRTASSLDPTQPVR